MPRKQRRDYPSISRQEVNVIERLRKGRVHKEIAEELHIETSTVSKHLQNVMRRNNAKTGPHMVDIYLHRKHGIIDFPYNNGNTDRKRA